MQRGRTTRTATGDERRRVHPGRTGRHRGDATELCCAPAGTADEDLIRVAGSRWAIEECFRTAKTETGLDQYQVLRYDAWYRHITLAMLAARLLAVTAVMAPEVLAAASSRSPTTTSENDPKITKCLLEY